MSSCPPFPATGDIFGSFNNDFNFDFDSMYSRDFNADFSWDFAGGVFYPSAQQEYILVPAEDRVARVRQERRK